MLAHRKLVLRKAEGGVEWIHGGVNERSRGQQAQGKGNVFRNSTDGG